MKSAARRARAEAVSGQRAGLISRLAAGAVDLLIVWILLITAIVSFAVVRYLLGEGPFRLPETGPLLAAIGFPSIEIVYLTAMWAGGGRSVGKQIVGLRVVKNDGAKLRPYRAFSRAVFVTFFAGPSLLWAAVSRRNAAVHDIVLRTAVVHDWTDAVRAPATPTLDYTPSQLTRS